tara:strand:- start:103 stop:420 length:318 start_codon:yes stop_codon:yes gene_type:complete
MNCFKLTTKENIMETIKYNASDWSGEEHKVTIRNKTFRVSNGWTGTYTSTALEADAGTLCAVEIDGHMFTVYGLEDGEWHCDDWGISRMASNPIVAALQIGHNTI